MPNDSFATSLCAVGAVLLLTDAICNGGFEFFLKGFAAAGLFQIFLSKIL